MFKDRVICLILKIRLKFKRIWIKVLSLFKYESDLDLNLIIQRLNFTRPIF